MSVLFKGMEMPTNCRECHLKMNCDECEGWKCVCVPLHKQIGYLDDLLADKRREDCPLVPVPPHGRLIDADALKPYMLNAHYKHRLVYDANEVANAPTIVPAEEGE